MHCYFVTCFGATLLVLMTVNSAKSFKGDQTSSSPSKAYDKIVVCNAIQDSHVSEAINKLDAKLENLIALVDKNLHYATKTARPSKSQVFTLKFGSQNIPVYCHMGDFGCGGGGWTLAMKINGAKRTFHYDSHLWRDRRTYNLAWGKTGFDSQETKLPTYWNTPFSKICLGMKIGQQINFIVINKQASSLYSLIADGQYRATSLGRNTWKTLIGSQASLQHNCNREGFNAVCTSNRASKARIGFLGNNENDCVTCDSRIGFGTAGSYGNVLDDSNTCGNEAFNHPSSDNGGKHIKAMGYILVQ